MSAKEGQCIHFNGVQHDECEAGVRYQGFKGHRPCIQFIARSVRGGTYLKVGEKPASIEPWPHAAPKSACVCYQDPTPEQIQQQRMGMDAAVPPLDLNHPEAMFDSDWFEPVQSVPSLECNPNDCVQSATSSMQRVLKD